jgi:predicted nuclease of restriction endonuclease-like RecB superfamily
MLTTELAIADYDQGFVRPDRLRRQSHGPYLALADAMLQVYRNGIGLRRRVLHARVRDLFQAEDDCPLRRIDAFCKLLDDVAVYQRDRKGAAANLRRRVFRRAAEKHPLVAQPQGLFESSEATVKAEIAAEIGLEWQQISEQLFADVLPFQTLMSFPGYASPQALLARYNVAQTQAVLYRAESLTVWASQDLKTILRYAKLARLIHTIERESEDHYRLQFDGPASSLRSTTRYGVAMAKFLPALLSCRGWRLEAHIRGPRGRWTSRFLLDATDGLSSPMPPPEEFDSAVEADFATQWLQADRQGWILSRENVVLHAGQKTFIPDFVLRHPAHGEVLLEVVGFWTAEYLEQKRQTVEHFGTQRLLLAAPDKIVSEFPAAQWLRDFPGLITYKTKLSVASVLKKLPASP